MFEAISGYDDVKGYLRTALRKGSIGQSLMFAGFDMELMGKMALEFAHEVLNDHTSHPPDLHIYHPEGKLGMHSIESMRKLSEEVYLSPYKGNRKVFIIYQAERMLPTSSNALLKTFEEPAEDALLILLTGYFEQILPTIRSRCRLVRFCGEAPNSQLIEIPGIEDELYSVLRKNRFGTYKELMKHVEKIASLFEDYKKERVQILQDHVLKEFVVKVSAVQSDAIVKESEGIAAMECSGVLKKLLEKIIFWYRDLELLKIIGDEQRLFHPLEKDSLSHLPLLPLESVSEFIQDALLAYQRSTSLSLCLENLFLKLGKL